ncbi:MAG: AAA family ATPase [Clostridiales bacterium]|nr:AAA family ATPase [Clostridiales bacterium]
MLERKILTDLSVWKNDPDRMCLMVKGARQVGKSTTIQKFCRENYKYFIEMNFVANEEYKAIFAGNLEKENILKQITLYFPTAEFIPNETVIFLDEIQDCPRAITALKFLAQDERFDVITSGSLLGITYKHDKAMLPPSVPVGYVDHLEMHSLDFEEFLWANNIRKETIEEFKAFYQQKTPVLPAMHTKLLALFREYIVVGGMPRVVQNFVNNHNFGNVLKLQRDILEDYKKDIAKYAEGIEKAKVRDCFLSIPNQLAKKYKKFQWNLIEKQGSARKYRDSIMWLIDAGMVEKCDNLTIPELPLAGNVKDGEFKIYMRDTGLLVAMLEDGSQKNIINGDLGIYKGALYENIIADIFKKSGKQLFYFAKDNRFEIDFIVRADDIATAVEVKAGDNTKAWSVVTMVDKYSVKRAIKLSTKNVGIDGKIETLPLYMAMFI